MIVRNMGKCLKCNSIIESKHRHDFVTCACGNVSVDGGRDYLRRSAKDFSLFQEMSEEVAQVEHEFKQKSQDTQRATTISFWDEIGRLSAQKSWLV